MKHKILSVLLLLPLLMLAQKKKVQPAKQKSPIVMTAGLLSIKEKFPDLIFANDSAMVVFTHQGSKMTCDSAIYNQKKQFFEAFGHVKGNMGDSVYLNCDYMNYDGATRKSESRGNVILKNKKMTLTTQKMYYDRNINQAWYDDWGTVRDEDNTMVSKYGRYYVSESRAEFREKVTVATNINNKSSGKNYVINSNNLNYNTKSKDITVLGPTTIVNNDNLEERIYTENGTYNTESMVAVSTKNGKITTNGNTLVGDRILYNQKIGYGNVVGKAVVIRPKDEMILRGQQAEYFRSVVPGVNYDSVIVTKRAWLSKKQNQDSIYFNAKKITGVSHLDKSYTITGYNKARMYNKSGQAMSDSLVYHDRIGTLELYKDPILWYGNSQITGDSIIVYSVKQKIDSAIVKLNAMAIQKVDSLTTKDFNQIKGRFMYATFRDIANNLDFVHVEGNAQSLFFADENKKGEALKRIGINRSDCAFINASIAKQKLTEIACMGGTKSVLSPEEMVEEPDKYLPGFAWREKEKFLNKKMFLQFVLREEIYPDINPIKAPIKFNNSLKNNELEGDLPQDENPKIRTDVGHEEIPETVEIPKP